MIQSFADKYRKHIAYPLFAVFYLQTILLPFSAAAHNNGSLRNDYGRGNNRANIKNAKPANIANKNKNAVYNSKNIIAKAVKTNLPNKENNAARYPKKVHIGGPSSPEASSFKAIGSDNLVNLFTGDFSYSIPLLDVGGYPVNLFYSGGITMEQEASWVGLGWNINPGSVSRNMRGVPDDFNGEDKLIQTQNVKPNRTWGGEVGIDGEVIGKKKPNINLSLGVSYNNYLGPALDLGAGISVSIPIVESIKPEKGALPADTSTILSAGLGLNAKLSSRSGLTFSPSLNMGLHLANKKDQIGVGLSTSYNSRTGIKDLNLSMGNSHLDQNEKDKAKGYNGHTTHGSIASSSISFARPSFIPTLRMPMEYANYSGQLELGAGMFGLRGSAHAMGYYSESKVPPESLIMYKPLVGFMYSEMANGKKDAVMDFSRLNDAEVTPRTPILSAPQYAYDVFSIQGEGTGGSIRAYRGDLGYMRDNETTSKDRNISLGFDIAPVGHYGGNWNIVHTPTRVGGWEDANNTLKRTMSFKGKATDGSSFENIYFRNPGEATVTNPKLMERIGGDNLVRFKLSGSSVSPRLESTLEQFNKNTLSSKGDIGIDNTNAGRDKRTQVTTMLTAAEAAQIGLEKKIRNYSGGFNTTDNTIQFSEIERAFDFRKKHHISEINVLEQSGMRYVYGLPVYSLKQKDFTFSVGNIGDPNTGIVNFETDEPTIGSRHMNNKDKLDGYVMAQETPAYASSFLLTGLLSPDYVDVSGDGITEDDLGSAVKFDYTKSDGVHKWRTPRNNTTPNTAHYNEGLKSEKKDNKANISYGEREVWYMNAIESKSMVAIFKTEDRNDAKGVRGELDGRADPTENVNKRLKQIDLYTKAEIKARGIANARPIKTVNFRYSYSLCNGTPDNAGGGGKLTLDSVYFTYNGQAKASKEKYVFHYGYGKTLTPADNPSYANNASDKWGTYKKPDANPGGLTNADYPYTYLSPNDKTKNDEYAGAWSLKKIVLPSGGQMEVQYEADDYAYVQNRRACDMFNIYGLGNSTNSSTNNGLYNNGLSLNGLTAADNFYVYIKLPQPLQSNTAAKQKQEILDKYLETVRDSRNQLTFKLLIDMPNGPEPLTVYANYNDYGLCTNSANKDIIYIKLQAVDGKSPLSKSSIGFITENLPGQAFTGSDIEVDGIKAFLQMMEAMLEGIRNAFKNVDEQMRSVGKARDIFLDKSFVRLDNPYKKKYGGGVRVKKVIVKDNWQKMLTDKGPTTYGYTSTYGQEYDYTTTEKINGVETAISSGVASYEPGLGSEENPFREIVAFNNKMPLASAQYGAIEMPILDGLYPSPGVGYSKVTVRSIHRKGTHGDSALRSAIGKQVTEYYTAKEFPSYSIHTPMASMDYHFNSFFNFLYKDITDRKVTSQGFLVETNDMHGKMKSQIAYSESDEKTPLSYSYHTYKNTGKNGLNDKVDFVYNNLGGAVAKGNMGIDMELMTDVREFRVQTSGFNGQLQTDFFTFFPFPFFIIPMLPLRTYTENLYRAVTCTKLINYHAIEDSVIVMDKGSVISTKTIAYDAETGAPIVTKTANEFKDPIYNVNYPAYWAYSGMGLAYKNIDTRHTVNFVDGRISLSQAEQNSIFESGDELYITNLGGGTSGCMPESGPAIKLWAFDKNKNNTALTVVNKDLVFLDKDGNIFTKSGVSFRIVRSGKRNLLGNSVASATTMANPIVNGVLNITGSSKTVTASAMEYKEKWQTDNEVFKRYRLEYPPVGGNLIVNGSFENGNTGFYSGYTYGTANPPYGYYSVGTNPNAWCGCSISHGDHTTGTGKMMMVDGATNPPGPVFRTVWEQTVTVTPNTNYDFSVWVQNSGNSTNYYPVANLFLVINNIGTGSSVLADAPAGTWKEWKATWNSGNATSATLVIRDKTLSGLGDNFELDDIFFGKPSNCTPFEVPDCNGYLEKKINPYVKGLIGNYKAYRGMVYYGDRVQIPTTPNTTKIRKDGYLGTDFSMYWNFNASYNLVPNTTNAKWVWNNESLKYNSKGLELETKDALNIYTAAQYGFNKTMPVAVAKNSRYNEMFGEGFEDYSFNERINLGANANCVKKHIDFTGLGSFVNITDSNFNAHTGKTILKTNSIVSKQINISQNSTDDYPLFLQPDTAKTNINIGVNNTFTFTYPYNSTFTNNYNVYTDGNGGMHLNVNPINDTITYFGNGVWMRECYFQTTTEQYYNVPQDGIYEITTHAWVGFGLGGTIYNNAVMFFTIFTLSGDIIPATYINQNNGIYTFRACIKKGIYKVNCYTYGEIYEQCDPTIYGQFCLPPYVIDLPEYHYDFALNGLSGYKDITTANGCISSKLMPAETFMMNPTFKLTPGKRMFFSAWVREGCATPCINYSNSKVQLVFNDGSSEPVSINPSGAIIEGWQKVEGEFTVPPDATIMTLQLLNTGGSVNYWDDIRIQPFNSNMKTYTYDPRTLRLAAELDENNYATFYEYDEEGQLVRVKKETSQGIKTINETRAAKQKAIMEVVE
jgi:hypothetical protein